MINFGWIDDPVKSSETRLAMGMRPFKAAAKAIIGEDKTGDACLYKAWKDVLGGYPDYPAQEIGDCVSHGHGRGHDLIQCVELVLAKTPQPDAAYRETCTEALYGAAREVGGMLGNSDGCYGSAAVKAMTTVGMVPRELVGAYSGRRAKEWGRHGMPAELEREAAKYRLGTATLVTQVEEAKQAVHNGYTISICSTVGFEGKGGFKRDQHGFCHPGGFWPHCMFICGYIESDGKPSFVIAQSWGPNLPPGPQPFDLPPFCFRASLPAVAKILAAKDSYALAQSAQFVPRPLPKTWTNSGWAQ